MKTQFFRLRRPGEEKQKKKRIDNGFGWKNSPPLGGEKFWGAKKKDWRCRQFGAAHRREPKVARKKKLYIRMILDIENFPA